MGITSITITYTAAASAPTVTTPTSADVAATSATLGGNVTANGGATVTERGVVYSLASQSGDPTVGGTGCTKVTASAGGTGVFTVSVTGLSGSTAYKFRAYAKNSAGTSYSSVGTFTTLAAEYTWSGTGSGWYLKGDWNSWGTTHEMKTDANFGGGDYSRVTVNNANGTQTFKWHDGSSFWIGYCDGCATPAKNTAYAPGGGSWQGNNFSSSFFTSGKYYTFRGKFYENPSNSSERMNDFVIMETTGAPTEFVSAGAGNPSGTLGAVDQTVSVTLNQVPNSEETVYVRYTTDNWATSSTVALTTGTGTTRSGTIPAQSAGTTVSYYFLTTTVAKGTLDSNPDLCTLNGLKNGANNWSYSVAAASVTASAVSGSALAATYPDASSGYQSFTVSGSRLTGALTVTAPSGFAVCSTSGGTYGNTVTLTPSGTTLSSTTIYLKLAANATVGAKSGNVTISGGGLAANVTVAVSGAVTPKPPTKGTVTYPSNEAEGRVTIPWTKNTAGNDVMVVRVANNGTAPAPVNGTAYSTGSGLGGQIVYKGSATSYKDTGLTAGTDYDYYLFSVSGNYYSTGVKVDATASKAPRFSTLNVSKSTTVGGTASNTQTASGTPSTMTYSVTCTEGGATSGFSVTSAGVFSFTPTAAGTFKFSVSAANGVTAVSASSYTITVTVSAAAPTVGSPSRTGTTAVGATLGGTVSATGGATLTEWGVVYSATSLNTDPTVGGTGCTNVTASGTPGASAFTAAVTGLKANTEYKWKAYAVNSVGTGYTAVQTFTTPCMSSGPVVTPTPGNGTATFTWADVGAVQYLLSLWTGSGGYSFVSGTTTVADGDYVITGTDDTAMMSDFNSGKYYVKKTVTVSAGGVLSPGTGETLTTGEIWTIESHDNGDYYTIKNKNTGKYVTCTGTGNASMGENASIVADAKWTLTITSAGVLTAASQSRSGRYLQYNSASSGLRFSSYNGGQKNLHLFQNSGSYVTGGSGGTAGTVGEEINELPVSTGVTVAGLTPGTTYNWSLKAVGGGTGCEQDATAAAGYNFTVTPTAADEAPVWTTSTVGPWSATVDTQLSETMTDYLSTLGSPAPTFTVAAQGTAPAGSYAVTSAGAFTFTPAEGDAGKSFTFRFTASNSQGNPTKDVVVNVGALAPTITEGSKTIGTTSATLPITVNMRGAATTADITLVYGKTTSYGSSASVSPTRITTGLNAGTAVTGSIASGLEPGTTYSYKWTVQNSAGTTTQTGTFTTLDVAPAVASAGSLNVTVNTGATATLAATGSGAWVTAGTHLTYALSTSVAAAQYTWNSGTGTLTFTPAAKGTYTFNLTASNGRGSATYAWTVTAVDAPTVTPGVESTSGTTASVPATINAGGAATTVTFKYGTSEGTYNLNPASLSGGSVAAGATSATVTANLTGLTQGTTYYYQWTAVNAGGTTVETGSFFQPGDSLEFPGGMNGWAQSGTTTRDAEFGGCYYTPAHQLAANANPTFKEYKSGTWRGAGRAADVNGNGDGSSFRYTETSNGGDNTLNTPYAGYYTLRGRASGSGDGLSVEYVAMYTEGAPVTITGASDNHETQGAGAVTVTATLSAAPSASEKVFVRYSTDGWSTWQLRQMSVTGSTATYTIDGQEKGTLVEYYILTSPHAYVGIDPDLCTLRGLKSGTTNFAYSATVLPPSVTSVTPGYQKVSLAWNLNAAGDAVMVIRYAGTSPSVTPPTDGTAYAADTSALGGTVVYGAYAPPSGSATLDNVVSQGTGYTYVFYSVKNNKYSEGVVRTATTASLATPTVGVTTAGAGTLTGAAAGKGEIYVVARIAGSGSFSGNPSGAAPSAGQSLCGGTVVYKGTAGSFSVADMEGCQTYKYKAWLHAADENAWSAGSSVASVSMPTPAAPVLNALSGLTYQGFTASWNAVPGAVTYRMDIVKGGGSGVPVLEDDFEWIAVNDGNALKSALVARDWNADAVYAGVQSGNKCVRIGANGGTGWIITPELAAMADGGTLKFKLKKYGSDTGTVSVELSTDGSTWQPLSGYSAISPTADWTEYTVELPSSMTASTSFFLSWETSEKRAYLDDVRVLGPSETPVAGWTDKDVGSILTESAGVVSVAVTGLEELTTYSVTVRAEGATAACASTDSNTESATTLENDTVTSVAIANYDAAGEAAGSNVADGAVAAGQTVLLQGTKLTVAAGSVTPVLTGVTFATTGTATGSDIGTLRVRVGTSSTYDGTETALGTATYTGAGTYTVSGSQSLTPGTTYYVWIEAVTAAGAAGGSTVKVGALTKDAFAITNGRKTGSTTAAGTQTIGNLTAFSASTGSAQGGKVDLTWTAGASGTATVRWSDVSLEAIPAPGTAWANESTGLTGGSYTVTGLTGCKTYYFKAWEVIDGVACGTAQTDSADASSPAAPTGLGHGTPTAHEATLSWTAGAGAASHVIDLWHYEGGSGGGAISGIGGTYTLVTDDSELAAGNYVIVESGLEEAMNNSLSGSVLEYTSITAKKGEGNTLTIDAETDEGIVWELAASGANWTIKNAAYESGTGGFVTHAGDKKVSLPSTATEASAWSISETADNGVFVFQNASATTYSLQYNASSPRFTSYSSNQRKLSLYKQTGGGGSSGTKTDDIIAGVVQPESSVVTTNGATSVGLGHLTDGTTYYWTVKALGYGGCAGGVSGQDSFKTAELLGVPTIATPLTPGVEQLSGTVTGTAGATLILKRYDTEDLAGTGTAWGLDGTVVSAGETSPGSGVWTFRDTGLDGCKTYWYKAWQSQVIDGETVTSGGSAAVSGKTQLANPTVTATGAGTQLTVSWNAVPGAVSYKVQISDTENVWEATAGGEGAAVFDEAFEGFTATSSTDISGSLNTYTEETGWTGSKVYCEDGVAKLGSSKATGQLTTPGISALAHGGKVYFDLLKYGSDGGSLKVQQSTDGGSTWTTLDTFTPSAEWQTGLEAEIPEGASSFKIKFETTSLRAYIDNVRVVPLTEVSEGDGRGLIYEQTVTSAPWSRTKTGLEIGATYYYRVIVTGGEGCTSEAGGSAVTANAPIIEVMPTHYNFGTVTKNSGEHIAEFLVRNAGNVALKFSSVSLVQDGDAYSFVSPSAALRTADLTPGAERTYKVQFNPQTSGSRPATLRFSNDAYNTTGTVPVSGSETYANTDIPLSGMCFDPATADPDVLWLSVKDGLGVENTVWDDNMAHSATQPVLEVTAYHYNGMAWASAHSDWANWTLYDAEGTVVPGFSGLPFDSMTPVTYDGRSCSRFTAKIPALGAAKTYRGKYKVGVTLKDSSRTYTTTTTEIVPIEQEWLLDDFARADAVGSGGGALGNSWVARASSGSLPSSAAIRNASLELYGPGGGRSGTAGRVAAGRDMSDERYPTTWSEFTGSGSWGFHFKTGAKTVSWADGSTAGAFVLGATHVAWFTPENAQKGVAVMFTNDCVRLVRFEKSLLAGGTITDLTTASYNGTQGKWLAVRVDYIPGQPEVDADESDDGQHHDAVPAKMRLYVKPVAGPGGNPVEECTAADLVETVDVGDTVSGNLKYGGPVWNHGTAQLSETTGGTFDDLYVPHMDGEGEPMEFHVIDEDVEGPEFYGFSIRGAIAAPTAASSGMTVTGMVHDASGLSGTVGFKMYNGDTLLASGSATPAAVAGSSTEFTVSFTIAAGVIDGSIRSSNCRFEVTATDGDDDRSEGGANIDAMEGTASYPFTFCASTPTAPGWATAEIDGAEMVVLRWARSGGTYVVVRSDTEIGDNSSPQGRTDTMAVGTTVDGWGTVVYNDTGDNHLTGTWTAREFIVAPGSTNYFAVYGMTGDAGTGYYFSAPTKPNAYAWATTNAATGEVTHETATSSGVPVSSLVAEGAWPCVTPKYEPGEGVDSFEYRTSVTVPGDTNPQAQALAFSFETRPETGCGWGGPWTGDTGTWKVHDQNLLTTGTHFPTPAGNKLYWEDTSSSSSAEAYLYRPLARNYASGKFFVAGLVNFLYGGNGKYVNIVLVDDEGHDLVSFGKQGGSTGNNAAIYIPSSTFGAEHTLSNTGSNSDYGLTPGHGQDYVIAGELDWENKTVRMWVFYGGAESTAAIPQVYDDPENKIADTVALEAVQASWSWATDAPSWAGKVAGIKLIAGSDNTGALGHVYFDEIRFATTWPELFLFNDPEVYTYDFDKPVVGTGEMVGLDEDGHRMWEISDGALAHGNVGLNAQFGLYHRTGIQSAQFTILDSEGNQILKQPQNDAGKTAPYDGGTPASVTLSGTSGAAYSDWKTPTPDGATGVAVPTNRISLDETYTVEVTLTSAGGRQAVVTSASETGGGGATDLFFGEYGEGDRWDKYVEIYNGTGHDVDLTQYYLVRLANNQDFSTYYGKTLGSPACERLFPEGSTDPNHILPHGKTIVLLNDAKIGGTGEDHTIYLDRLAAMQAALTRSNCLFHVMGTSVLDAGGATAYLLITKEAFDNPDAEGNNAGSAYNKAWIDACGLAQGVVGRTTGKYIMSRKDTAVYLPRKAPDIIDESEWDYRDWGLGDDDDYDQYENFISTAGWNDRQLGLGGNMEFKVFDDDTDAPAMSEGGIRVGSGERLQGTPGDRTYVMGGWSFTNWPSRDGAATNNLTLEEYKWITEMWPYGMTTRGGVSWSPLLGGDDLSGYVSVIEAGNNKGESNAEFDGITQRKYGCMVARASGSYDKADEVWLGFDLDTSKLSEAVLSFGYAGGSAGFANARVEVSTTGQEGTFTHPTGWEFDPKTSTQNATTWAEWSGALADAGEAVTAAGHLWFRVVLKDYAKASGTFRLDNIRLEGAPEFLRVSDQDMNTQTVALGAIVSDANSGLDAGTATFTCGLAESELTADTPTLVSGGKGDSTFSWRKTGGFSKAKVQEWYEKSQEGKTQLRMSIADKDDDRPGDATTMSADFGTLDVYDDDDDPPTLEMATMKPRKEGTMAKWLLKEKTRTPSETMDGLDVGDLGLDTTAGTTSNPRYSLATNNSIKAYAVYQSGWQAGSKYWTATIKNTTAGAGTITRVKFWSKVGSVLAPTGYDIQSGTVAAGETEAETTTSKGTGSLLTSGPWVKEGAEGVSGSPIKEWAEYSKDVTIPIAAGETLELRIFGTGADADGIGATWYLWGLEFEGSLAVPGEGGEDGYTYVTDNSLAGGGTTLTMSGNVWDESGLAAAPTYSLTNAATGAEISSGTVSFTSAGTPASRTTKALGEFSQNITLSSMGYGVQLAEYKGGIHAEDADYDREDGSGNNTDKSVLDGQFAFTVIDQDLVGPTAPTGVKVNGVDVPNSTPDRDNVAWTNQPEFTVSFNVANDIVPTETQLTSADEEPTAWRAAHGITNGMVKKASAQTGAAGVGEYRVALPVAGEAPTAAAMSNAPAYSVAVTNGALANYGFERFLDSPGVPDKSWSNPDGDSGINKGNNVGGSYPVAEGTNSYYLRNLDNGAIMSQVIPFEVSASAQTLTLKVSLKIFKRAVGSRLFAKFEFSEDCETWRSAGSDYQFTVGTSTDANNTWLTKEMAATALTAAAGEKYLRFSLYSDGGTANIDDVRLSVRVGSAPGAGTADRATMRYLATVAGQGLDVKYLFAVDADNDRPQDRRLGDTAVFYTAYDVTPPTKVDIPNHGTSVSTDTVEDPTSQFDVTWSATGVGPDDPENSNHPTKAAGDTDILSPWGSYRFYYKPWDPTDPDAVANPVTYINNLVVGRTDWTGWSYAEHGKAIEDPSEVAKGHTSYDGTTDKLNAKGTTKARIYDLENDQDYIVVAVGVDAAGNVGKATAQSWATNNTIKFALTKGWRIQKSDERIPSEWKSGDGSAWKYGATNEASALEWIAAGVKYDENGVNTNNITKEYDLLYWDSDRFEERTSNPWTLSGSVKSNWFVDVAPALPRNTLRFYRASYKDRWKAAVTNDGTVTAQTPLVSEDVYSMATVTLTEGYNFVSLQGTPYTNTFRAVFGTDTNMWPCAPNKDSPEAGVRVMFYSPREHGFTEIYNFVPGPNGPEWRRNGLTNNLTDVIQTNGFFTRGFAIVLPDALPEQYRETTVTVGKYNPKVLNAMHWHPIMHVPTNSVVVLTNGNKVAAFKTTIESDQAGAELYNPVALNLPTLASPAQLGIPTVDPATSEVGFRRGKASGDRLYIMDSETKEVRGGSTIYCDNEGTWRWVTGNGEVGYVIHPNDMMVIITHGGKSNSWTWEYSPSTFYTLPTRHMGY